jgi:RsiW-degrading membrane proteinase PrsW (M82 family)
LRRALFPFSFVGGGVAWLGIVGVDFGARRDYQRIVRKVCFLFFVFANVVWFFLQKKSCSIGT